MTRVSKRRELSNESQRVTGVATSRQVIIKQLSNSIYSGISILHVFSRYRHVHNKKMASNNEVAPGGPSFCLFTSERYEDSLCQGSCALKNETVLCENQGDRLYHFRGRPFEERRKKKKKKMEKSAV